VNDARKIMTSQELLLALADKDTLELARRMIGKPRLAFLLAKEAIGPEGELSLDAEEVAQILGVHKRQDHETWVKPRRRALSGIHVVGFPDLSAPGDQLFIDLEYAVRLMRGRPRCVS